MALNAIAHWATEELRVVLDCFASGGSVEDAEELLQVVLDEAVEEDLVLVAKRGEEDVLGLVLWLRCRGAGLLPHVRQPGLRAE